MTITLKISILDFNTAGSISVSQMDLTFKFDLLKN